MLASDRATRRYRDPIAGPIAKVSSRRSRRVGSRDRTRSDPRGAVEIRWRAVSDQTAFRFPVSPGGFSKQMSASSSVKSGSGAYLGPRSAVYRLLQAQHKVRELLRPLLRLGRLTLLEQTQSEGESRGERDRDQHVRGSVREGGGIGKNRTAENKAVLSIVWFLPRAGWVRKGGCSHVLNENLALRNVVVGLPRLPRVIPALHVAHGLGTAPSVAPHRDRTPASNCV